MKKYTIYTEKDYDDAIKFALNYPIKTKTPISYFYDEEQDIYNGIDLRSVHFKAFGYLAIYLDDD